MHLKRTTGKTSAPLLKNEGRHEVMFNRFDNRVSLSGTLTTLTALRIGAGRATEVIGTDLPVVRDAIDRDTGTAAAKKLYDFEVVPAGMRFKCEIVVENAADWELGLLMIGLRPFELGEASLGGARSRGLGSVKIEWSLRTQVKKDQ